MERQKKIVDASVGVKWFHQEQDSNKAQKLLEDCETIVVPDLFFYEIANALRYNKKELRIINESLKELENLQLETYYFCFEILAGATELSIKHDLTIYDSLYLALAELLNYKLITMDRKLLSINHPLVQEL